MGIKDAYLGAEEKWYSFWEKTPLVGVIDAIDTIIPSMILFVLVIILIIAFGAFFLLSSGQVYSATFTIVTNDNRPVYDSLINVQLAENGNIIKDISQRSDNAGVISFNEIKAGQELIFDINLSKGTYSDSIIITENTEETIRLRAPAINLSPVTKNIFVKTSSGLSPNESISLAFACENSSAVPIPSSATFSGSAISVTEPAGCQLTATVNHPKYKQQTYRVNSTMYDLFLQVYEPASQTLKVTIRSGGFVVSGTNFTVRLSGTAAATSSTDTAGTSTATLPVTAGTYTLSVTDPKGVYALATKTVSITSANAVTEVTVEVTKSVRARVSVKVTDAQTGAALEGAIINVRDSYGAEVDSFTTTTAGEHTFAFTDLGTYTFVAKKVGAVGAGYFAKETTQTLSSDANIILALDKITSANAGKTKVTVKDQDGLAVANAKVMLKYSADEGLVELIQSQNYSLTDVNGEATIIAGNASGEVFAYAIKGPFNGTSSPKQIRIDSLNTFSVVMQVGMATVRINALDEAGNKIDGTAEILLVDGTAPSARGIAGLISVENGTAIRQVKAGQTIFVKVSAPTFENYYTTPLMLWPDKSYSIDVTLLKQIAEPKVRPVGVFNEADAAVQTMAAGKKYYAKFLIDSDDEYNQVIFNFRAGKEELLENDVMQVEDVEAGNLSQQVRGVSYSPTKGYEFDGANLTDGLAKWVSAKWNNFGKGTREIKVWFRVKPTAPQNSPLQFFYRASFDTQLKPASTATEEFYADTYSSDTYYVGTEAVCTAGFCANSEWLYSDREELYINAPFEIKQTTNYKYHYSLLNNTGVDYGAAKKPIYLSFWVMGDSDADRKIKITSYSIKDNSKVTSNTGAIYSIENIPLGALEKNSVLDVSLNLEGLKQGAEALHFELKADGQVIYTKETDIAVVKEKDFNVAISPQFIPAMIPTQIEVDVVDELENYLPDATVNLYAKEPGFDKYMLESQKTNRLGRATVLTGAHIQGTQIIVEVIKEGYSRRYFSQTVSAQVISVSPSALYVQLNTFSKRSETKTMTFINNTKKELTLKNIVPDAKFKDLINESALNAYFNELSSEQKIVPAEDSIDVPFLRIQLSNNIPENGLNEPITVEGKVRVNFEEAQTKMPFDIDIPLRVNVSSSANPSADCIVINPTGPVNTTTENAQVQFTFEIINACDSDGVAIPLENLVVSTSSDVRGTAELSVRNATGTKDAVTAVDHSDRKLLDKISAGEKLFATLTFAPDASAVGKSVPLNLSISAKFRNQSVQSSPNPQTFTVNVVNLKECMSITSDTSPATYSNSKYNPVKIQIDTTACLGQTIDVWLCKGDPGCSGGTDGKIVLHQAGGSISSAGGNIFTLRNSVGSVTADTPTYPGTYGVSVHARTRGTTGWTYIGELPVSFLEKDSQYFNLNKFEVNLIGTGAQDSIILTNKMLTETVNVRANACIWGKEDAEFNWAAALSGAMMGAMLGNMIGSAYTPPSKNSNQGGSGSGSRQLGSGNTAGDAARAQDIQNRLNSGQIVPAGDVEWLGNYNTALQNYSSAFQYNTIGAQYGGTLGEGQSTYNNGMRITNIGNGQFEVLTADGRWVTGFNATGADIASTAASARINNTGFGASLSRTFFPITQTFSSTTDSPGTGFSSGSGVSPSATGVTPYSIGSPSGLTYIPTAPNGSTSQAVTAGGWSSISTPTVENEVQGFGINPQYEGAKTSKNSAAHFAGPSGGGFNYFQLATTIIGALVGGYLMGNANLYKCEDDIQTVPMDAFVVLLQGTEINVAPPSGEGSVISKVLPPDAKDITFTLNGVSADWDFNDAQYSAEENVGLRFENTGLNEPEAKYGTLAVSATVHDYGKKIHDPTGNYETPTSTYDVTCHSNTFGRYWIGAEEDKGSCDGASTHEYTQKYHIRVISGEPKEQESYIRKATACYMGAMTGSTGEGALPRVKLDWSWGGIKEDTCDYGNEDHYYCDATQFTIALTKKLASLDEFLAQNQTNFVCPPDAVQDEVQRTIDQINSYPPIIPQGSIGVKKIDVSVNPTTDTAHVTVTVLNNTSAATTTYMSIVLKGEGEAATNDNSLEQWSAPAGESTKEFDLDVPKFEGIYSFTAVVNGPMGNRQAITKAFLNRDINGDCWMPKTTKSIAGMPGLMYYVAAMDEGTIQYTQQIRNNSELYNHINFGMYLTKDAFTEDFFRDFKEYYLNTLLETVNPKEREIVDYLTSGNFVIRKKFTGDNEIEPGLYDVWVIVDSPDQFRVIDANKTKLEIQLLLVKSPGTDSPFYRMPIDGLLGEKNGRQGYGSTFRNVDRVSDKDITISNTGARYYTFYNSASNGVTSVSTKTTSTFEGVNSSIATRGQLGAVSVSGGEGEIALTPNYATPMIVKKHLEGTEGNLVFTVTNSSRPLIARGNLTYWTGAAKSKDFYGANAVETYYNTPDYRLPKLGENYFGFSFNSITHPGDMYLKSTLFTPVEQPVYVFNTKDNDTTVWTPSAGDFVTSTELRGIAGMQYNSPTSYVKSISDLFSAVENNEVCLSNDGTTTSFWWNPAFIENEPGASKSLADKERCLAGDRSIC